METGENMKQSNYVLYMKMLKMCNNVNQLKIVYDIINENMYNDINKMSLDEITKINQFYCNALSWLKMV